MTLLSHPHVAEAEANLRNWMGTGGLFGESAEQFIREHRTAILTALQEGEDGLDFFAAKQAANVGGAFWFAGDVAASFKADLDRQHRARLAAEREKWEAEVETLRGQLTEYESYPRRPLPGGMTPEEELDYWRSETLALDTWHDLQNKRVSTAEARVQRLEAAGRKVVSHYTNAPHCGHPFHCVCQDADIRELRALLPEETTK